MKIVILIWPTFAYSIHRDILFILKNFITFLIYFMSCASNAHAHTIRTFKEKEEKTFWLINKKWIGFVSVEQTGRYHSSFREHPVNSLWTWIWDVCYCAILSRTWSLMNVIMIFVLFTGFCFLKTSWRSSWPVKLIDLKVDFPSSDEIL